MVLYFSRVGRRKLCGEDEQEGVKQQELEETRANP